MGAVELVDAAGLSDAAEARVADLRTTIRELGIPAEVVHVGSTAYGAGLTKGDVDALVRIDEPLFAGAREALTTHLDVAQPESWTPTYASFTDRSGDIPVGLQVVIAGSDVDARMRRQHALLGRPEVRAAYDRVKSQAAPDGPDAYWRAKDAFWSWLDRTAGRDARA